MLSEASTIAEARTTTKKQAFFSRFLKN